MLLRFSPYEHQCTNGYPLKNLMSFLLIVDSVIYGFQQMDAHSLAIELSPALLWRKSKLSPPQSPKRNSEPKQAVHAMSLQRFSGTKSQGVTHEKGSPPLKQSNISVRVTVQGDADDNWQDLQGDFCFTFEFCDAEP
jgi:hypothetical protein